MECLISAILVQPHHDFPEHDMRLREAVSLACLLVLPCVRQPAFSSARACSNFFKVGHWYWCVEGELPDGPLARRALHLCSGGTEPGMGD